MSKPVAWMALNELNGSYSTFTNDQKQRLLPHVSQCYGKWIPLYTHPVKEQVETIEYTCPNCQTHVGLHVKHPVKELTDEEILEIANGCLVGATAWHNPDLDPIEFAKAILRKAQEK